MKICIHKHFGFITPKKIRPMLKLINLGSSRCRVFGVSQQKCGISDSKWMQHGGSAGLRERPPPSSSPPPPPFPPSRASPRVCPPVRARAREVAGVVLAPALSALWPQWQLRLTALRLSLRQTKAALSLLLSVSVSRPPIRLYSPSLSCLGSFHGSQPRSRRVEGSALSSQTAATPARPLGTYPLSCCCRMDPRPSAAPAAAAA